MTRLLLAALLAAGAPALHHTKAGTAAAKATLLAQKDLGKSWKATAATAQQGVPLTCSGHSPSARGIVETGAASSPAFRATQAGPFVQQNTSVYGSAGQASTWWKRAVTPALESCAAQTFQALRARGIKVSHIAKGKLAISTALGHTASYRISATASGKKLYFDLIVLGNGNTITAVTISSFIAPVPAKYEKALATLLVRKLGGPAA